jgi:hypothetical protein
MRWRAGWTDIGPEGDSLGTYGALRLISVDDCFGRSSTASLRSP